MHTCLGSDTNYATCIIQFIDYIIQCLTALDDRCKDVSIMLLSFLDKTDHDFAKKFNSDKDFIISKYQMHLFSHNITCFK